MEQRIQFITDWRRGRLTMRDLCDIYNVSRKTSYKWLQRFLAVGPEGLEERSHAAAHVHNKTSEEAEQALLQARLRHPSWGAKKLLKVLTDKRPELILPGRSTVCDILSRNGLVTKRPRRRAIGHPGRPGNTIVLPNDVWSADFKGEFRTGDGIYCYPLTVTDNFSRYLLQCQGLGGTAIVPSKEVFTRVFKEYGLPRRIRTDNGTPFASNSLGRLPAVGVVGAFGGVARIHRTWQIATKRQA